MSLQTAGGALYVSRQTEKKTREIADDFETLPWQAMIALRKTLSAAKRVCVVYCLSAARRGAVSSDEESQKSRQPTFFQLQSVMAGVMNGCHGSAPESRETPLCQIPLLAAGWPCRREHIKR